MKNEDEAQGSAPSWFLELRDRVHREIADWMSRIWNNRELYPKEFKILFQHETEFEDEDNLEPHEKPTELDTNQRRLKSRYTTKPLPQERAS